MHKSKKTLNRLMIPLFCFGNIMSSTTMIHASQTPEPSEITLESGWDRHPDVETLSGDANQKIEALRKQFPDGKYWNHQIKSHADGSSEIKSLAAQVQDPTVPNGTWLTAVNDPCNTFETVTDKPCGVNGIWDKYHGTINHTSNFHTCNNFENAIQCCGFAHLLFYKYHGISVLDCEKIQGNDDVRVGDMIELSFQSGEHYAFVIGVTKGTVFTAECNYDNPCKIRWDGAYSTNNINAVWHGGGNPLYRVYNPNSGEHHYTTDTAERNYLIGVGWADEGISFTAAPKDCQPVYRVYNANTGDHHYTIDDNEKKYLISVGWKDEGIGWYSYPKSGKPVYRVYNPNAKVGTHHYTTDYKEYTTLGSLGWKTEGIAFYAVP